ncbi:MAG TPA: DNA polymerase/3'-5' exonuclease PolX [Tepidisphaeraceae bacterium]|jgi:DNA polymerase (family 10)|nr:DNA polymerase/3'-5' exonuclease PolX [Tepidisphaeraceae bacterium]
MALNHDLAEIFRIMAAVMEIKGESVFKAIAFSKVSRILNDMTFDIKKAHDDGTLKDLEGIGPASRKIIEDYIRNGRSVDFEEVSTSVPAGLLPMLEIPGLGPKTISLLWKERGITNQEELVRAIDEGKLDGLKGIGAKKIDSIKQGIALRAQAKGRVGIVEALPMGESLIERVRALKGIARAEVAGSLRRRKETIGDVDIVAALTDKADPVAIAALFVAFPEVQHILGQGASKASVLTAGGLQVDLRMVPEENFGAALLYFTGSKDHNVRIRGRALDKGMTLSEWGLYDLAKYEKAAKKTAEAPKLAPIASRTEADVYAALGLAYVEPELREDRGEVALAEAGTLPKLIQLADIRGDLHTHTTASDGTNSIEEMAEAAKAMGYAFLAITDHSKSQVIANGLTADRLLKHVAAIRKVADKIKGIKLLAGCEVDILVDGRLDFDDAVLKELDIVVASPHVSLKQDSKKATDRIKRAIDTRYVNIIGHPTGRLINSREGLPLDFAQLFPVAAKNGTAMEINAGYPRLDLNEVNARAALETGVMLSINTDAHSVSGLTEMIYGINVARRAGTTVGSVINCMEVHDLMSFIAKKR